MKTTEELILDKLDAIQQAVTVNHDWPMTPREAADYLKVKPNRIEMLRKTGRLAYTACAGSDEQDRQIRFRKSDLDEFLKRERRAAVQ